MPQAIAIAADVDEVTVMDEAIDERRRHDLVAEDLAPSLTLSLKRRADQN